MSRKTALFQRGNSNNLFDSRHVSKNNPLGMNKAMLAMQEAIRVDPNGVHEDMLRWFADRVRSRRQSLGRRMDRLQHRQEHYGNAGKWAARQMEELGRVMWADKSPAADSNVGKYVSVEIECLLPSHRELLKLQSAARRSGLAEHITLKRDGSIERTNGDQEAIEIVVTTLRGEYAPIQELCRLLSDLGAAVNASCGLHVHFDFRHKKSEQMLEHANRVARCVPALKTMLPHSRRNNRYCDETINDLHEGERYAFVNVQSYSKYKTLEIRGHSGTISATKIINWIEILTAIMDSSIRTNGVDYADIEALCASVSFPEHLREYMVKRYSLFKQQENGEDERIEGSATQSRNQLTRRMDQIQRQHEEATSQRERRQLTEEYTTIQQALMAYDREHPRVSRPTNPHDPDRDASVSSRTVRPSFHISEPIAWDEPTETQTVQFRYNAYNAPSIPAMTREQVTAFWNTASNEPGEVQEVSEPVTPEELGQISNTTARMDTVQQLIDTGIVAPSEAEQILYSGNALQVAHVDRQRGEVFLEATRQEVNRAVRAGNQVGRSAERAAAVLQDAISRNEINFRRRNG